MSKDAISINLSCVDNDGELEGGIHISTSDGVEINSEINGSSYDELIDNLITDVMAQYDATLKENQEKKINCGECQKNEVKDEDYIHSLEAKIDALQNRLDVLEHERKTSPKRNSTSYNSSLKDVKDIEKFIKNYSKLFY